MATARIALGLAACVLVVGVQSASAQEYRFAPRRYRIDRHDERVRDARVQQINNQSSYILRNGRYYYQPPSIYIGRGQAPQMQQVQFGSFSHVDDLANRLELQMKMLLLDMHYNYSHNPGFRATYAEAYQLYQVAQYVHAAEHQNNRTAIQRQLGGMDGLFHHIEEDVAHWTRHHHVPIGHIGMHARLSQIEDTLHHLMNDVGVEMIPPAPTVSEPPVPLNAPLKGPLIPSAYLIKR